MCGGGYHGGAMLAKYKKQANISAAVWFCTLIIFIATMQSAPGNIWINADVPRIALMSVSAISFWFAFWAYARAKGQSGLLGLVLPFFSVIGLLILVGLKDRHPETLQDQKSSQ